MVNTLSSSLNRNRTVAVISLSSLPGPDPSPLLLPVERQRAQKLGVGNLLEQSARMKLAGRMQPARCTSRWASWGSRWVSEAIAFVTTIVFVSCSWALTQVILPEHLLALTCQAHPEDDCRGEAAIAAASGSLEASRAFVNLAALCTMPTLTLIADRMGRKPVILLAILSLFADALACLLCTSLHRLLIVHTLSGLIGNNWLFLAVVYASRADTASVEGGARQAAFALVEAAVFSAILLGPVALGELQDRAGVRTTLTVVVSATGILIPVAALGLRETLPLSVREHAGNLPVCWSDASPHSLLSFLFWEGEDKRRAASMMALCWGAMRGVEYLLVPYTSSRFSWGAGAIGRYTTISSCVMILSSASVAGPFRRWSHSQLLAAGALLATVGCLWWVTSAWWGAALWVGSVFYSAAMFLSPVLRSVISEAVGPLQQSRALGCAAAVETACAFAAPFAFGTVFEAVSQRGWPTSFTYLVAAVLFAAIPLLNRTMVCSPGKLATGNPSLSEPLVASPAACEEGLRPEIHAAPRTESPES